MKAAISILLILFSLYSNAQFKNLYSGALISEKPTFIDSIKNCIPELIYNGNDSASEYDHVIYAEHFIDNKQNEFGFQYGICFNKKLMPIQRVFCAVKIWGSFETVFKIWNRYFSAESTKDKIKTSGSDQIWIDNEYRIMFRPLENDIWAIFLY